MLWVTRNSIVPLAVFRSEALARVLGCTEGVEVVEVVGVNIVTFLLPGVVDGSVVGCVASVSVVGAFVANVLVWNETVFLPDAADFPRHIN